MSSTCNSEDLSNTAWRSFKYYEDPFLDKDEPVHLGNNIQTSNPTKSDATAQRDAASSRAKYEDICYCSRTQSKSTSKFPTEEELLALQTQRPLSTEELMTLCCYIAVGNAELMEEVFEDLHLIPRSPERTGLIKAYRMLSCQLMQIIEQFKALKPIVDEEWQNNPQRQGACCRMCIIRYWQAHHDICEEILMLVRGAFMY